MRMEKFGIAAAAFAIAATVAIGPFAAQTALAQPAAGTAASQVPQPQEGGVNWSGVGYGAGAVFGSLLYIPCKLVYAITGSLVGGGAWLLTGGNTQTADTIWRSSLGGDYVLTPDMISGNQPINFSGPTSTPPEPPAPAAPSAASASAAGQASSSVAPIAPLPQSGGAQPMDRGSGPAAPPGGGSPLGGTSIE
ncbi:MAG: hypothetical protein ACREQI_14300 [Candidatus Binataceae bacterium]